MSNLRTTIAALAEEFAAGVLSALRRAPLEDLHGAAAGGTARRGRPSSTSSASSPAKAPARGRPASSGRGGRGRRIRRSSGDIDNTVSAIVSALKGVGGGLRAEQIRDRIGVDRKELPLALKRALESRLVSKKGQKRATTYFAK